MSRKANTKAIGLFVIVGVVMIIAGIVVLMFVVFQLWGTDIQESRAQDDLRGDRYAPVELRTENPPCC